MNSEDEASVAVDAKVLEIAVSFVECVPAAEREGDTEEETEECDRDILLSACDCR